MQVCVVMGNDFPDAVFATEAEAERYCALKRAEVREGQGRIYWRVYKFNVQSETGATPAA